MSHRKCTKCLKEIPYVKLYKAHGKDLDGRSWNGSTCPQCHSLDANKGYRPKDQVKDCVVCTLTFSGREDKLTCSQRCYRKLKLITKNISKT